MIEPTLFRKVFCFDKRPTTEDCYDTQCGCLLYKPGTKSWWSANPDGLYEVVAPEYWFEPVYEPTGDEIESMALDNEIVHETITRSEDFVIGFKKALEYLKTKT